MTETKTYQFTDAEADTIYNALREYQNGIDDDSESDIIDNILEKLFSA